MPNKYRVGFIYWVLKVLNKFSMWLESSLWGYKWCKLCGGDGKYPNSGMWEQPDGYKICPRCRGHRWEHVFGGKD